VFGYHPREQFVCAFDIVSPAEATEGADAEILSVATELVAETANLHETNCFVRLNHTDLLAGILTNCGVPDSLHEQVYAVMREGAAWTKMQRTNQLAAIGLPESTVTSLLSSLEQEGSPSSVGGALRHLARKKNAAAARIKQALHELEALVSRAKAMGVSRPMLVSPSFVYNPGQYSGMICQVVRRKKRGLDVLAAGGRYDRLVSHFGSNLTVSSGALAGQQSVNGERGEIVSTVGAVGISFSLDRLAAATSSLEETNFSPAQVFLCAEGCSPLVRREADEIVGRLWAAGIACVPSTPGRTADEVQEDARKDGCSTSLVVIVRESTDGSVRVRSLERDRFQEKRVPAVEIVEYLQRNLSENDAFGVVGAGLTSMSVSALSTGAPQSYLGSRSVVENSANIVGQYSAASGGASGNRPGVTYRHSCLEKAKYSAAARKKLETSVSGRITPLLTRLAPNVVVEVLTLSLPAAVVRATAAFLDLEDENSFQASVASLRERHSRHRKELTEVCDEIQTLARGRSSCPVIVLYAAEDHQFATVIPPP
jgi:translation initiation factor 2-alpha kinase 4